MKGQYELLQRLILHGCRCAQAWHVSYPRGCRCAAADDPLDGLPHSAVGQGCYVSPGM